MADKEGDALDEAHRTAAQLQLAHIQRIFAALSLKGQFLEEWIYGGKSALDELLQRMVVK